MVDFKTAPGERRRQGDRCILGLDVGSTTTKAVLVRVDDDRILASDYLRTNGDPVRASRDPATEPPDAAGGPCRPDIRSSAWASRVPADRSPGCTP